MSIVSSDLVFHGGGRQRALTIRHHTRARRLRLSVDPRDGRVVLTMPPRVSERTARAWAEDKRAWVERALAELPVARPIRAGEEIPYRGGTLTIEWSAELPRTILHHGNRLRFGGAEEAIGARVLAWLKHEARRVLDEETRAIATIAGVTVGRIDVGDPRTRWGSCSAKGDIRYSWRLLLAPSAVLKATVAHEVAHRVHMNHGADFHALAADLFGGDPEPERRWLRANGCALYSVGRSC